MKILFFFSLLQGLSTGFDILWRPRRPTKNNFLVKMKVFVYSLINMRQLQILIKSAKIWHRIVCWFSWIYLFLPVLAWCAHKIVLFWSAEQFYEHIMQKLVKTGKYTEINKQSHVKFWLNWRKYRTVSYSFSCTYLLIWFFSFRYSPKRISNCLRSCWQIRWWKYLSVGCGWKFTIGSIEFTNFLHWFKFFG